MNIAVKGSQERTEALNGILSSAGLGFTRLESTKNIHSGNFDVVFDLNFDDDSSSLSDYIQLPPESRLFLSSVKIQLEAVLPKSLWAQAIGINAMNSFLNRPALECCSPMSEPDEALISSLGWKQAYRCSSRVGLVAPRVVCMIINEAYYTLQEGTAEKADIDLGMKLGTAYPYGPFEWSEMIGIKDVYETLSALYADTHDERYRICSLLKTEYLKTQAV